MPQKKGLLQKTIFILKPPHEYGEINKPPLIYNLKLPHAIFLHLSSEKILLNFPLPFHNSLQLFFFNFFKNQVFCFCFLNIYLFMAALGLSCSMRDLLLWLLSSCGAWAPECVGSVAVWGLSSCGVWAPECVGSLVAAHRLSCPAARGILVPWPGIKPASPALEGRFLTTGPPGKSPVQLF